jgi:cysteine-rich repeat protein
MVRALAVAVAVMITAVPVAAQSDRCGASKLKATGKKCYAKAKCGAKAAASGEEIDISCMDKAEAKFLSTFSRAEARGGCFTSGDASAIEAKVDAHDEDVRDELWTNALTENDCASAKLRAAGRLCSCELNCFSRAAKRGVPVDVFCQSRCANKFHPVFTKAEAKGGCTTTLDRDVIADKVDVLVEDVVEELQGPTTTTATTTSTTTTTIPVACGNGLVDGTDECDDGGTMGGDGCSAACELESVNPAVCAGIPTGSGASLDTVLFASGFSSPVHVTAPRLDPSRLFVVEQGGRIMMVKGGVTTVFMDITSKVASGGERGLLSMAFHPDYETNGSFYVYYTQNAPNPLPDGDLIIARYQATSPDLGDPMSETPLVTITHPASNHNGGNLNFGPDGFLYAATGDGGGGGDPSDNAQNDLSQLGKVLRIDPTTGAATNWAKGLRNPYRFSFDRDTGDIYIGDVGQGRWEEVSYAAANPSGVNYGWDDMEGRHCFEPNPGCLTAGRTIPVLEYCNTFCNMTNCPPAECTAFQTERGQAVTGGFVYRGCAMPDLRAEGRYFYSDFYTAFIRSFAGVSGGDAQNLQLHTTDVDPPGGATIGNVSSFGEDTRGELYIVDYDGEIFKIVPGS